ncbi:hypothetical protein AB0D10_18720 [Kitasatospora sp. NPDC048545]|uniref:hypothetical protein n=1 Tax=Kitasatospora sp. NPDC048545 TaxID=3157208 RepID=UPI0034022C94
MQPVRAGHGGLDVVAFAAGHGVPAGGGQSPRHRFTVKGPDWSTDRTAPDRTLAVERPARSAVQVEALLDNGVRITPPH